MNLKDEFRKMITRLSVKFTLPLISTIFFPPFHKGGQPKDAQFMAVGLEGGAAGISFVILPDEKMEQYNALAPMDFIGKTPEKFALEFGSEDPVKEMISMAAVNAICQHVMKKTGFEAEPADESLGMLSAAAGDRVGMVGLFSGLVKPVRDAGAELVIIEKEKHFITEFPDLPITLDAAALRTCNKILCTSSTILNNSLDDIIAHCSPDSFISIVGPTAGYFPDPLFARGVDVVGGRIIKDGARFFQLLADGKGWKDTTHKTFFHKKTYSSII